MNDYHFWLAQGICPHCHHNKLVPGRHACSECLAKSRKRVSESRQRKLAENHGCYTEHEKENRRNAVRNYRKRHLAAGLCLYCNNKALPGIQLCEKHRRKTSAWNKRKYNGRTRRRREHLDPPMPAKKTKTDLGKLFALYNVGWLNKDIADELRISESTVYSWLAIARKQKEGADDIRRSA